MNRVISIGAILCGLMLLLAASADADCFVTVEKEGAKLRASNLETEIGSLPGGTRLKVLGKKVESLPYYSVTYYKVRSGRLEGYVSHFVVDQGLEPHCQ